MAVMTNSTAQHDLRLLMLRDAAVWRERTFGMAACDDESLRLPYPIAKVIGVRIKRVRRIEARRVRSQE